MTKEEQKLLMRDLCTRLPYDYHQADKIITGLNVRHFDYRGLIEKDFKLEAPEGILCVNFNNRCMNSCKFYPQNFSSYEEYVEYLKEEGFAIEAPKGMYN